MSTLLAQVISPLLMISRKRYVGNYYMEPNSLNAKLKAMGGTQAACFCPREYYFCCQQT
jgi:hypothetical protein